MRLDLNSCDYKVEIINRIMGTGYSWTVTAIDKAFNAKNLDGYRNELAKKSGDCATLDECFKNISLAVTTPEDWFSIELIEHLTKKENAEWIKEQTAKGSAVLSNPLPPECPVCSKLLKIIPLKLKNKKVKLYTVCRYSCSYSATVFPNG
jgi:hypothetical protein